MDTPPLCALLVLALLALCGAAKLPEDFIRCNINDEGNLPQCLTSAVGDAIRKMKDGKKSIGVPSLRPLMVDEMKLDLGSGPIPLVIEGVNISVSGVADSDITSAILDMKGNKITAKAHTPRIRLDFMYKANGNILLVAVKGEGPAFIELQDVETTHQISANPYEKKGKTHWNVTEYSVEISPKKMVSQFDGLFKGDPKVSDQINTFLNNEWKVFFQQIKSPAQSAFGAIFQQIANRVFSRVPLDEIFLYS